MHLKVENVTGKSTMQKPSAAAPPYLSVTVIARKMVSPGCENRNIRYGETARTLSEIVASSYS